MKTIPGSRRGRHLAKFTIFLVMVALTAAMVGCVPERYELIISSTEGGKVTMPGEGKSRWVEGSQVHLTATPEEGYLFANWTGDEETIDDVNAASTFIIMNGNYSITANFEIDTIEIRTWNELDAIRHNLGGNYILINDLDGTERTGNYTDLAGPTADHGMGWKPIGDYFDRFTGSFDGQGYEVRNLSINRATEDYVGLFGYVEGEEAVIQNVTLVNATVTGDRCVGSLVGRNEGGTVSDSYFTGNVTGTGDYVGGLVGRNERATVSDSYSTGNVTGTGDYVGGLVGQNHESTVSDSHSSSHVTGKTYVGGLVGGNYEENTVSDSYFTGSVSGDVGVGGLVGYNRKSILRNSHYNHDEVLINGQNVITIGALFSADFEQWLANGKFLDVNERLSQENGHYVVNNVTDFKELLAFGQNSSLRFRLTNDLDLGNEPDFYIPYFAGKDFDGNGHKISNLSLNFDFVYSVGLFGCLAPGGGVTRVDVENAKITGTNFVGVLVGANFEGDVSSSNSTGSVTGHDYVGGLVGRNYEESAVSDSYSTGNVTGHNYVGGLVGANSDTVSSSNSTGKVTGGNNYIGGLVGWNRGEISESHSTGSVSGNEDVGGLVGLNKKGTVSKSCFAGNVTGDHHVGGLVGRNEGEISESHSKGSVTGNEDVGGLVGSNNCLPEDYVERSYSTSNVTGDDDVGGLVGWNKAGLVSNCYSRGSVTGNSSLGGLVGLNDGTVNSSYSTGRVSDGEDVGGLVGKNDKGTVTRSFWDIETSGQATSAAEGEGKTTEEMKSINTFTDWRICEVNFASERCDRIWNIVGGGEDYPFLSWQV